MRDHSILSPAEAKLTQHKLHTEEQNPQKQSDQNFVDFLFCSSSLLLESLLGSVLDFILIPIHFAYIKVFFFFSLQEVGSIIGKKGEIVKRFRDEVRLRVGNASIENWEAEFQNQGSRVVEKKKESSQTFALSESPKGIENCQRRSFTTLQIVLTIGSAFV